MTTSRTAKRLKISSVQTLSANPEKKANAKPDRLTPILTGGKNNKVVFKLLDNISLSKLANTSKGINTSTKLEIDEPLFDQLLKFATHKDIAGKKYEPGTTFVYGDEITLDKQ